MPKLVALALPGGSAFVDALQRVWDAGNVALPVDLRLPRATLEQQFSALGVVEMVGEGGEVTTPAAPAQAVELLPGDAIVVPTSGTTGEAKGVIHTHDSVAASARITSAGLGVTANDHWLACLPLAHIGGLSVVTRALLTDTKLTVLSSFDVETVSALGHDDVTLISLVNTAMRRVDTSLFRKILLGGAAPAQDRPSNAVATYGMTETGSGVVYDGRPLDEVLVRADDDGQLWIKSPTLLRAYTSGDSPVAADGWFATGDGGAVAADGTVSVSGRLADVIVSGGEKVWPSAVEAALRSHPAVAEALVFGVPDPEWDQRVVAQVELLPDVEEPTTEAFREHVKTTLAGYQAPREVRIVPSLPRTASGKVKRPLRP